MVLYHFSIHQVAIRTCFQIAATLSLPSFYFLHSFMETFEFVWDLSGPSLFSFKYSF